MRIIQSAISEQLNLERVMRIELTTFSLATRCSTAELHPLTSDWLLPQQRALL